MLELVTEHGDVRFGRFTAGTLPAFQSMLQFRVCCTGTDDHKLCASAPGQVTETFPLGTIEERGIDDDGVARFQDRISESGESLVYLRACAGRVGMQL